MRILIEEDPQLEETEITIRCTQNTPDIQRLVACLEGERLRIPGRDATQSILVPLGDILYFESVDKHTFFYTDDRVLETDLRLYEIEAAAGRADFFRATKSTIVNLQKVVSIQPVFGAKAELLLCNKEKIMVSRQFFPELKRILHV